MAMNSPPGSKTTDCEELVVTFKCYVSKSEDMSTLVRKERAYAFRVAMFTECITSKTCRIKVLLRCTDVCKPHASMGTLNSSCQVKLNGSELW